MELVLNQVSKGNKIKKLLSVNVNENQYLKVLMKKIDSNGKHHLNNDTMKLNDYCYKNLNNFVHSFVSCVINLDLQNSFNNIPFFWKYINDLLVIILQIERYPPQIAHQLCDLFESSAIYFIDLFGMMDEDTCHEFNLKENVTLLVFKLFQQLKPLPSLVREYHPIYDNIDDFSNNQKQGLDGKKLPMKYRLLILLLPQLIKSFQNNKIFLQTLNTNISLKLTHLEEYELDIRTSYSLLVVDYFKALWLFLNKQDILGCLDILENLLVKLAQLGKAISSSEAIQLNYALVLKVYAIVKLSIDEYIVSDLLPNNIQQLIKLVHDGRFEHFDRWLAENKEWLLKDQLYLYLVEKLLLIIFKNLIRITVSISKSNKLQFKAINIALKNSIGENLLEYQCSILKNILLAWSLNNGWLDILETLISLNHIKGNVVDKLELVLLINNGSDAGLRQVIFPRVLGKMK